MEIELDELLEAVAGNSRLERWLWKQIPEKAQLDGSTNEYVVDSLRVRYNPPLDTDYEVV